MIIIFSYTYHVSKFENFFVTTFPKSMPKRSTILWARSGCDVPENILIFGISVVSIENLNLLWLFSSIFSAFYWWKIALVSVLDTLCPFLCLSTISILLWLDTFNLLNLLVMLLYKNVKLLTYCHIPANALTCATFLNFQKLFLLVPLFITVYNIITVSCQVKLSFVNK